MSSEDIQRGQRWSEEIAKQLDESNVGIICLTPENLHKPWVLFEAGALAKIRSRARVCTYLVGLRASDLAPPMSIFQATLATQEDTFKLVHDLNTDLPASVQLNEATLRTLFDSLWPTLEKKMRAALALNAEESTEPQRGTREILEEIFSLVRLNQGDQLVRTRGYAPFARLLLVTETRFLITWLL